MAGREQSGPGLSGRARSAALVVGGLLLFCWPFVRTPPLGLVASYIHLLVSWGAIIVLTALVARSLGRGEADRDA